MYIQLLDYIGLTQSQIYLYSEWVILMLHNPSLCSGFMFNERYPLFFWKLVLDWLAYSLWH